MNYYLKFTICWTVAAFASLAKAYPQRVYAQHLVYYPPPTTARPIHYIRVRRGVAIENTVATSPQGGQDVALKATKVIGNENIAAHASVFAQGNTKGGDAIRGVSVGAASHGIGASVSKVETPISEHFIKQAEANLRLDNLNTVTGKVSQMDSKIQGVALRPQQTSGSVTWQNNLGVSASVSRDVNKGVSDTLTKSISANLFNNGRHSVDGTVFKSNVALDNGFKFDKTGGVLDYSHAGGHGLSAGLTRFSGIGKQASVGGYTNLFTSNDGSTTINAHAGGSKWLNGPMAGQRDLNVGLGLTHRGGGCSG